MTIESPNFSSLQDLNVMGSKVKTAIYSELPEKEKEKFMEFMVNNNIEFVQDNEGNYIATI